MRVSYECAQTCVPPELYNFLAWVVFEAGGDMYPDGFVVLEKMQHEKVLNLGKNPKQVGLALHIMNTSRSKDMVTL